MFGFGKKQCQAELAALRRQIYEAASELKRVSEAVRAGDLDVRAAVGGFDSDLARIVGSLNDTLDAVVTPFQRTVESLADLGRGEIPEKMPPTAAGDVHTAATNLNQCIDTVSELMETSANAVVKAAYLDKLPTPVMAIDREFTVQFMNAAGAAAVGRTPEACLGQKCFNLFNTDQCNSPDCQLHKAMQRDGVFTSDTVAKLPSGNLPIRYTGAPLKDSAGAIIGALEYVVDIRTETSVTQELLALSDAATAGRLEARADTAAFDGNYRRIVAGVNAILDVVIGPLNVAAEYIERIGQGDLPEKITDDYQGDFNEIKNNLNLCIDAVTGLVNEANALTTAAVEGRLDARGDAGKFQGEFATIIHGINSTLDAVIGPLNVAAEYIDRISKGNIPEKISDHYAGDFNEIKNNLNQCIDTVNDLVGETVMLTEAAVSGKLDTRGNAQKFAGAYAELIAGVNTTFDTLVGHIDQMPAPFLIIDREFNVRYINQVAVDLIGMERTHLLSQKCYDLMKTSDCKTGQCACARAMTSGIPASSETDAHPGKKNLLIAYNGVPIRDRAGNIVGGIDVITDQTEMKRAMNDARTKVEYLNNIPTPVMVIDREFTVQFMNPAGATAVGKTPEACVGLKCFNLFQTDDCNTANCQLGMAMQRDQIFTSDTVASLSAGRTPIRYTGAPLKDANGAIVGALEYVVDISKEVEITDSLLELSQAALGGRLDTRVDVGKFQGNYQRIVQGVNDILDALIAPLNVAAEYVDRISKGDIPEPIAAEYRGGFNEIKNNINLLIDCMQDITSLAQDMSTGNLMVDVKERSAQDGLMLALKAMQQRLHEVVADVKNAAQNVSTGSQAMSAGAEELSQGASEQAAAAEQASSSMEQMLANIKQNADNSMQTEKIAIRAAADARASGEAVLEAVQAMQAIAKKIDIIEDIARQTRMLSLNATIEAAKAQEHGKGFGVVASEVRALSERSQAAANEINGLASTSLNTAERAGAMLKKLVPDIQKTAELVQEISAASREQSTGAGQINNAIQQLDTVIQQNSATSEEMASTIEELAAQAEMLYNTMGFFSTNGHDADKAADAAPRKQPISVPAPKRSRGNGQPVKAAPRRDVAHPMNQNGGDGTIIALEHDERDDEFERY